MLKLYCGSYPKFLHDCSVAQAFLRLQALLTSLSKCSAEELPSALQSSLLKEQFFGQLTSLMPPFAAEMIGLWSRQAVLAGLLCGAIDGAYLYLADQGPEDFQCPSSLARQAEELDQVVEVADQYWRGLDLENLEAQASFGKEENQASDQENIKVLLGAGAPSVQHQLSETFRTSYGIGLIEAAQVFLYSGVSR